MGRAGGGTGAPAAAPPASHLHAGHPLTCCVGGPSASLAALCLRSPLWDEVPGSRRERVNLHRPRALTASGPPALAATAGETHRDPDRHARSSQELLLFGGRPTCSLCAVHGSQACLRVYSGLAATLRGNSGIYIWVQKKNLAAAKGCLSVSGTGSVIAGERGRRVSSLGVTVKAGRESSADHITDTVPFVCFLSKSSSPAKPPLWQETS